jgi:hypothetical protein
MTDNQQPSNRVCKKCGETKPLEQFAIVYAKNSRGVNYRQHTCSECAKVDHATRMREARRANPDKYRWHQKSHRRRHPERVRRQRRESGQRLRDAVFLAYGGFVCKCCGETYKSMLTIDHINGDGNKHRAQIAKGKPYMTGRSGLGDYLYRDLRERGFPSGFQVLCYNCNISKHRLGRCEHSIEGSTTIPKGSSPPALGGRKAGRPRGR